MNPPFQITPEILLSVGRIGRLIGRVVGLVQPKPQPQLRKSNLVRTIQGSLAKDYIELSITISTATASRDLKQATETGLVSKSGEKALTRYRFL